MFILEIGCAVGMGMDENSLLERYPWMIKVTNEKDNPTERCETKKVYKVWKVSYNYDCSFDRPNERHTDAYCVVAESAGDAEKKASELFFKNELGKELFEKGEVRVRIKEHTARVPFPKLSLEDDVEGYFVEARLGGDGKLANRVIEYVVSPYIVKRK